MQADQAKPLAAERKAQRLSTAERLIQSRIAEQRYDEALAEADRAIGEYPAERSLRALRAAAQTGIQEKAAVAGVAGEVLRLIAAGDGGQAEQVLMDSLRRYPGRKELTGLRAAVDAARRSPRTHPSREPALKRAFSEIEKLLGMGKLP
jgi:hypothetical protein